MSRQYPMQWTVLGNGTKPGFWLCRCSCGTEREVNKKNIKSQVSRSCGKCIMLDVLAAAQKDNPRGTKHGMSGTSEYAAWAHMKDRCLNPESECWDDYGGRGITVCERWLKFENFIEDVGLKPSPELKLDRIDNEGNYEPGNCRWTTQLEQSRNSRRTKHIEYNGRTQCIQAWADEFGMDSGVLAARIRIGWTFERAISEAVHYNRLTKEQVEEIKRRYDKGSRNNGASALAKEFKVSFQTVLRVANGKVKRYEDLLDNSDADE